MRKLFFLLAGALQIVSLTSNAQTFIGLYSNSYPANPAGPVYSVSNAGFATSTGAAPTGGALSVSATYSDQQYGTLPNGLTGYGDLGMMFGVSNNNSSKYPTTSFAGVPLSNVGSPVNGSYSPLPQLVGTGMNVNQPLSPTPFSYGFNMFTSAEGLVGQPTDGRYYFGKVTFTFSRPVSNPVLHVTGLGGFLSVLDATNNAYTLPFETELELQTGGITIQKISGTSHLQVDSIARMISNNFQENEYILQGKTPEGGDYAGTGSIRLIGVNITSVEFKIYVKGLSAGQTWSSTPAFANQVYNGDRYNISFTLLNGSQSTLPVSGLSLTALPSGKKVVLNWKTLSETSTDFFDVEVSKDGVHFSSVGRKNAAGNSSSEQRYTFVDEKSALSYNGGLYYRIKSNDVNGTYYYSNVSFVRFSNAEVRVWPNPFVSTVQVSVNSSLNEESTVQIMDVHGKVVMARKVALTKGMNQVEMTNLSKLPAGNYFLQVFTNGGTEKQSFKLQKQ